MVVCWVDRPTTSTEVVVGQSLWAGVDAGKADHYCVVIDADEQRLELPLKSWRVRLTGALIDAADDGPRGWKSTPPDESDPLANAVQCARFARVVRLAGWVGPETSSMMGSSAAYWCEREGCHRSRTPSCAQAGQGNQLPARQHPIVLIDSPLHDPQLSTAMRRCLRRA